MLVKFHLPHDTQEMFMRDGVKCLRKVHEHHRKRAMLLFAVLEEVSQNLYVL